MISKLRMRIVTTLAKWVYFSRSKQLTATMCDKKIAHAMETPSGAKIFEFK